MKFPKAINHISSYQFYQLVRYGALILIGILLTKSSVDIVDIGNYETFLFLAGAVTFFWISGLMNSMLSLYTKENDHDSFFFNAFVVVSLFNGIIVVLLLVFKSAITGWIAHGRDLPFYNILLIYLFLNTPTFLIEHIFLIRKEGHQIIKYGVIIYALQIIFVVVPIYFGYSIEASLYGLLGIAVLKLIFLASLLLKHSKFVLHTGMIKAHLHLAWPLMATAVFSGSADYIDGIIVTKNFSPNVFAIFRFGARELPFTLLLANAMSVAMVPMINSEKIAHSLAEIRQRTARMMHYLFPISILLILTSKILFPLVFNAKFEESAGVFNVFLLLITSRLLFPQTILIGLKKTRIIMIAAFVEIIINVSSSLLLLPEFGIVGVAMGTVIAYFSEKIILILYLLYFRRIRLQEYFPVALGSLYSILLVLAYLFTLFIR